MLSPSLVQQAGKSITVKWGYYTVQARHNLDKITALTESLDTFPVCHVELQP